LRNAARPRCALPRLGVTLIGLGLWAAFAAADEIPYLPSGTQVIESIDLGAIRNSKTYLEVKKQIPKALEKDAENLINFLVPLSSSSGKFSRVTTAKLYTNDALDKSVNVVATAQPVTVEDLKKTRWQKSFNLFESVKGHKEIKVGKFTVYQEIIHTNLVGGQDSDGDSGFCLVEPKLVLWGHVALLKKVLEQNQKPTLSANMQAGLQEAGSAAWSTVVDFEGLQKPQRELEMELQFAPLKELGEKLKYMVKVIRFNNNGTVQGSIALYCTNAAGAADARKLVEAALADLKKALAVDPKASASEKKAVEEALALVNAVKVSVTGAKVQVTLDVEPDQLARLITASLMATAESKPPKKGPPEK
jgi:hypothetical protein